MAIIQRVGAGLLVLTLLVAGCDDDDTDDQAAESSTEVDGTDDQGPESDPDYGTDQESGSSTELTDSCEPVAVHADWAAYISACQYEDGRVEVVNESAWVLVVNAPWASSVVIGPSDEDLSPLRASAVNTMLASAPAPTSGGEYLPPGAAATALGPGGPVYLDFDRHVTPETYAVDVLARWGRAKAGRRPAAARRAIGWIGGQLCERFRQLLGSAGEPNGSVRAARRNIHLLYADRLSGAGAGAVQRARRRSFSAPNARYRAGRARKVHPLQPSGRLGQGRAAGTHDVTD